MRKSACRPFTVLDGMVLVAATAVGLECLRRLPLANWMNAGVFARDWSLWIARVIGLTSCFAVPCTCAMLVLRLRRPRPARRSLARQPGLVACLAGVAGLAPGACWIVSVTHYR